MRRLVLLCVLLMQAQVLAGESPPAVLRKLAMDHPAKVEVIRQAWQSFGSLAVAYSASQGVEALEALTTSPVEAIYSLECFPAYFRYLTDHVGAGEAVRFIAATARCQELLNSWKVRKEVWQARPESLALDFRYHDQARNHLFTSLEAQQPGQASQFLCLYVNSASGVRRSIEQNPQLAFFLLETREAGVKAIDLYGPVVAEIASFYQPGRRHEVIAALREGSSQLLEAYRLGGIWGWKGAVAFPALYQRLVHSFNAEMAVRFLSINNQYLTAHCPSRQDPYWAARIVLEVERLSYMGLLDVLCQDPFALPLAMEVADGAALLRTMGDLMPAALILHYYPQQKEFLTRFLLHYGVAPLAVLHEASRSAEMRRKLLQVIDKCGEQGLLLLVYAQDRELVLRLILEDGLDRGKHYVSQFTFDSQGIPSHQGRDDWPARSLVKLTVNYFWYSSKPTWPEIGLAAFDAVDLVVKAMTMGSSAPATEAGREALVSIGSYALQESANEIARQYILEKLKEAAIEVALNALKKTVREELCFQEFNHYRADDLEMMGRRVASRFLQHAVKEIGQLELSEFLQWEAKAFRSESE